MTVQISDEIKAVLLDIEGTTTPIDFVYQVLFPFARRHAPAFIERELSSAGIQQDLDALLAEHATDVAKGLDPPAFAEPLDAVGYVLWLMDRDRKSTPLKSLQGKIWEAGYRDGELKSEVYQDVPEAFDRWRSEGKLICIYSSGSMLAQKLLFAHTRGGDLTGYINRYFDTNTGPKIDPESYSNIARSLDLPPARIAFFSDLTKELAAARAAGLEAILVLRPGNHPQPDAADFTSITSF